MARVAVWLLMVMVLVATTTRAVAGALPVPPVLVEREALRWPDPPAGTTTSIDVGTSTTFTLFVPAAYAAPADGAQRVVVHFHGASWWVIQEHTARGSALPLLACNAPGGDRDFEADIGRPGVFGAVLDAVARELIAAGAPPATRVDTLEVSSFSGGYAGAMALLRSPEYEPMIARLVMHDSMYVRDAADSTPEARRPNPEALAPLVAFARKAVAGERTLLFEHSSTPSLRSVGPRDCSRAIIAELGLTIVESVPDGAPSPTTDTPFPLLWRADAGRAHFWCYLGETSAIHLAHLRNQAAMARALDEAEAQGLSPARPPS